MMIEKIPFRRKILLLSFLPLLVVAAFAFSALRNQWQEYQISLETNATIQLMSQTSELTGESQRERGRSSVFLNDATHSRTQLDPQRTKTDTALKSLLESCPNKPEWLTPWAAELVALRKDVDSLIAPPASFSRYTNLIRELLTIHHSALSSRISRGIDRRFADIILLEDAREGAGRMRAMISGILTADKPISESAIIELAQLKGAVEINFQSKSLLLHEDTIKKIQDFVTGEGWKQVEAVFQTVLRNSGTGGFGFSSQDFFKLITAQIDRISEIITLELESTEAQVASIQEKSRREMIVLSLALILIVSLVLMIAWMITRSITRPVAEIVEAAKIIQQGDASRRLKAITEDEIGTLILTFNSMSETLETKAQLAKIIAGGDLTQEVALASEQDTLGLALQTMRKSMQSTLLEIKATADRLATGSQQIADASTALAQGATEQAASLEEISSSMTEISSQTRSNAENATQANTFAGKVMTAAGAGKEQMDATFQSVSEIGKSSNQIAKIIKVIDDIAFQTNLLALNAAVEAARAGQHGKGFAVVADEVRNLAGRSAKAAKETAEMIESSLRKTEEGVRISQETKRVFDEIYNGVKEVGALVSVIATASHEQSEGISQVTIGINQIDQVTQSNTASAEETASSSQELLQQANDLRQHLTKFRL